MGGNGATPPLLALRASPLCLSSSPGSHVPLGQAVTVGGTTAVQPPAWGQGGGTFPNRGRRGAVMLEGRGKKETEWAESVILKGFHHSEGAAGRGHLCEPHLSYRALGGGAQHPPPTI